MEDFTENGGIATEDIAERDGRGRFVKGNTAAKGRTGPRPSPVIQIYDDAGKPLPLEKVYEVFDGVVTEQRWAKMIDRVAMNVENNGSVVGFNSLTGFRYPESKQPRPQAAFDIEQHLMVLEEQARATQAQLRAPTDTPE